MNNRAGKFVQIGNGISKYYSFVPEFLPPVNPSVIYDEEMIYLLSEANMLIGRLDEVTDALISPSYFVYMYARKEATLSSQIEGTKATFSDLIKAEAGIHKEIPNDVKEIENYVKAVSHGFERMKTLPLSLRLIREIHEILMQGVREQNKTPGEFRKSQNWVGGYSISTASYIPPSVEHMQGLLDNFEKFMHKEDYLPELIKIALLHSQFEMIHPFLDGNGRVGRLLIAFYLAANEVLHKPTLYISKYFKKNREAYYDCLYNIHSKGDYETWIKFFLEGIIKTSREAIDMARAIGQLKENDLRTISALGRVSKNALSIYEGLFDKPTTTIEEIMKKLKTSNATAGRLAERLIEAGILEKLDNRERNKVFVYKRYIDIFNEY
ncbi:MAG: cell filamentation protein Fic [Clostridiales bacterium]|nr:MAG: cell filamentation protein Fic [Clostridiales bacterium]